MTDAFRIASAQSRNAVLRNRAPAPLAVDMRTPPVAKGAQMFGREPAADCIIHQNAIQPIDTAADRHNGHG